MCKTLSFLICVWYQSLAFTGDMSLWLWGSNQYETRARHYLFWFVCGIGFGFHRGYVIVAVRRQYGNHCEALSFQHVCVRVWYQVGSHRIHVTWLWGSSLATLTRSSSTFSKFQCPLFQFGRLYHTAKRQHSGNRAKHCYLSNASMHMVSGWVSQDPHHMTMRQQSGNPHRSSLTFSKFQRSLFRFGLHSICITRQRGYHAKHCYLSNAWMHMVSGWFSQGTHVTRLWGSSPSHGSAPADGEAAVREPGDHQPAGLQGRGEHAQPSLPGMLPLVS